MSSLAKYFLALGKKIAGSDVSENEYVLQLMREGIPVYTDTETDSIKNYEVVVYSDAINETDGRLIEAERLSKVIVSRGQLLYEVSRRFNKVIAVSGCHGKTTCSSMLAHIFFSDGKKFTAHIGGNDLTFSNFYSSGDEFFITEACEYKKNFLLLKPDVAVILNSDADHLECYGSEAALKEAYMQFAENAEFTVHLYLDLPISGGVNFGFDKSADYYAKQIKNTNDGFIFSLFENGSELGKIILNVKGKHNVLNAVAAAAVARHAGVSFESIRKGLASFIGVERRFERIGEYNGVACIADYAHHPNELRAVIRTAQKMTDGKLIVIFQPHTYSRTKNLFKQFLKVLCPLNNLMIYKTFAAREYFDDEGSALTLSRGLKKSKYGDSVEDIVAFIKEAKQNDLILFLGAGNIYYIAKNILSTKDNLI